MWSATPSMCAGLSRSVATHPRSHCKVSSASTQPQCRSEGQALAANDCESDDVRWLSLSVAHVAARAAGGCAT
eukprot:9385713-Pyramimonas_sp.AAC.1